MLHLNQIRISACMLHSASWSNEGNMMDGIIGKFEGSKTSLDVPTWQPLCEVQSLHQRTEGWMFCGMYFGVLQQSYNHTDPIL
jgi:hypothetical protein